MTEQNPQGTETDPTATAADPSAEGASQGGTEPNGTETDWKAHAREWEKRAKANAEAAKRLAEIEAAQKTDAEKLAERVSAAESRAAEIELSSLRLEVALDNAPEGAPMAEIRKLAKRLTGSTRDELKADAEELFSVLAAGVSRNRRPDPSQGHSSGGSPSLAERIREAETKGDVMGAIALKNELLKQK